MSGKPDVSTVSPPPFGDVDCPAPERNDAGTSGERSHASAARSVASTAPSATTPSRAPCAMRRARDVRGEAVVG